MAGKIAGAQTAVIADAGQAANLDQPEGFNRPFGNLLAGLPPT